MTVVIEISTLAGVVATFFVNIYNLYLNKFSDEAKDAQYKQFISEFKEKNMTVNERTCFEMIKMKHLLPNENGELALVWGVDHCYKPILKIEDFNDDTATVIQRFSTQLGTHSDILYTTDTLKFLVKAFCTKQNYKNVVKKSTGVFTNPFPQDLDMIIDYDGLIREGYRLPEGTTWGDIRNSHSVKAMKFDHDRQPILCWCDPESDYCYLISQNNFLRFRCGN